jgi:hypothetical protein
MTQSWGKLAVSLCGNRGISSRRNHDSPSPLIAAVGCLMVALRAIRARLFVEELILLWTIWHSS